MKESGNKATEAATEDDGSDDMLAQLLKAVEAGAAGAGEDGDLTKMFMGMMEQLSNKEMLYEPMKELDGKFEPWIKENKEGGKVAVEDMERYETQAKIVKQIVLKFEEPGYTDDDAKCREYIWERMQEMQAAGSPPEELISNPLMEDLGGLGGMGGAAGAAGAGGPGGVPDCPQQ
jgi:peroxin-19